MLEPSVPIPADEFLSFAAEQEVRPLAGAPWKILVVDDEEEVHTLTRLVLRDYVFEDRPLELMSAYSAAEALDVYRENPDIALILLDVVMEREDSGLWLVRRIRDGMGDRNVRIILRTGQPGQAPEMEVVAQYDINDYRAKTELTSQKLFTTVTSALRSWRDIQTIEQGRQSLQRALDSSRVLFELGTRRRFAGAVLDELLDLARSVDAGDEQSLCGVAARLENGNHIVAAGRGPFADAVGRPLVEVVPDSAEPALRRASRQGSSFFFNHSFVACVQDDHGQGLLFLLRSDRGMGGMDCHLVQLFLSNVALAYHNVNLSREIIDTQKEIIHTLGEVVETRSRETANHVMRVGKMAHRLGELVGLEEEDAAVLRLAAPMHDVGKVGIPDELLHKPGRLTDEEYRRVQEHSRIGYEILGKSERRIMRSAAVVALQHHERWDGRGYPQGLAGEQIDLFSRITALVDVFDALANHRCYRPARELADVVCMLREERGAQFDPVLVDVFLGNLEDFVAIIHEHPDLSAAPEEDLPARAAAGS